MAREEGEGADDPLAGLPKEEATEAVLAREAPGEDTRDPEAVRTALGHVTEDGVVGWDAADESVAHAAKVVSTPETRVELASMDLSEAREAAEPFSDVDVVGARLAELDARLETFEAEVADLAGSLQAVARRCEERRELYEVAAGLRDLTAEANRIHGGVEDLKLDGEAFETWLGSHRVRVRELDEDVDAVADSMDELAGAVDRLAAAVEPGEPDAPEASDAGRRDDHGVAWFDASLRRRVMELLVADLRTETEDLRALARRQDVDGSGRSDETATRLDDLEGRAGAIADRLEDLAKPAWRERFGDRLAAFDAAVDEFEPPIDWGEVQAALESHRAEVDGTGTSDSGPPTSGGAG